ncbi:hypothetical protein MUP56_02920 [Patescibacteria group bacterium]|nr:hypothetical protein [Patescibacteria group bacterium]
MKLLAAADLWGPKISPPTGGYGGAERGIVALLTNVLRLAFAAAGIFAFINFIIAGYQYMSAGGDAKALNAAWSRIWQSLVGLLIIVMSFALISLISYLMFGEAGFILNPKVYGPGQ